MNAFNEEDIGAMKVKITLINMISNYHYNFISRFHRMPQLSL